MNSTSPDSASHLTRPLLLTVGFLVLVLAAVMLYPSIHPYGGMSLRNSADDIKTRSLQILTALELDSTGYSVEAQMFSRPEYLERLYARHGMTEGNRLLRENGLGYNWKARLHAQDTSELVIHLGSSSTPTKLQRLSGEISFRYDAQGKLVRLLIPISDSLHLPSRSAEEALGHARKVLAAHARPAFLGPLLRSNAVTDSGSGYRFSGLGYLHAELPQSDEHTFVWAVYDQQLEDTVDCSVTVSGNIITNFEHAYRSTNAGVVDDTAFAEIVEIVFYAVLGILTLIGGFRRLRAYEIGFRSAIAIGITSAVLMGTWLYIQIMRERMMDIEIILSLIIAPLFVGLGFLLLWAISESVCRETWKEKLISFDLLFHGHFLHSRLGSALLTGLTAGAGLLVLGLLAGWAVSLWEPVWMLQRSGDSIEFVSTPIPSLFLIGESLFSNLAGATFFLVFFISLLRQRVRSTAIVAAIAALILTLIDIPNLVPLPDAYLVLLPVLIALVLLFLYSDVVATITAMTTLTVLSKGLVFLMPGNSGFFGDALLLGAAAVVLIICAIIAMTTADRVTDPEDVAPVFQRHITERQRLARELEIARDVQMSFLPKRNPVISGLDIASHCAPALEVGGDYYDFIEMGPKKLGIAIGDVSGKGTQAAFYMTLTKGFLKALGRMSDSPSRVLAELNRLFYDNVERGHFISMIYAVFDMDKHLLTVARAGHSPVMRRRADSSVEIIQSKGIALGFEAGKTFSETIEEVTVPLESGDVFVFYTDGYPEAMTRAREEFGEKRLTESLENHRDNNAQSVLDHLYTETQRFTGRALQHDDMTMVVVHVN